MILLVLALCLVMAGCGAVGEPLPPLLDIPVPVTGLTAVQRGEQIQIAWPPPTLTTEGAGIRPGRQGQTKIYRAVLDGLRENATPADLVNAQEAARIDGKLAAFTDRVDPAWAGHTVVYAIQMTNPRGETAGYSNLYAVAVLKTPPAPTLAARTREDAVILEWEAQSGASYNVYRDGQLLDTVTVGRYEDHKFEFDHPYQYVVRGLAKQGALWAESADSAPLGITPTDTFPPLPPAGLRVVRLENTVELTWTPNTEGDLAGYFVLRNGTRLNQQPLTAPVFKDTAPGASPRYTVIAVDRKGNESPKSEEAIP